MRRYKVVVVAKSGWLTSDEDRAQGVQDLLNQMTQTRWKFNTFIAPDILKALGFKGKVAAVFEQGDG